MRSARLTIPACLTVTMLGCAGRVEPDDDTSSSTGPEPTTQTTTQTTTEPTTQTTTQTTTSDTSTSGESSTTGPIELPDCSQHAYVAECDNEPGCVWRIDDGGCVIECAIVPDLETCIGFAHCVWTDECGYPGPI